VSWYAEPLAFAGYSDLGTSPEESGLIGIMTAGISLGGVATFVCIPYLAARLSQRQMIILGDIIVVVVGK
jgi:hypothetical protein